MTLAQVVAQVDLFNEHLAQNLWLDVDIECCSPQSVIIHGSTDLSSGPDVEATFETIFVASLLMTWKTNTSDKPVLRLLTGAEAVRMNLQYQIEQGFYLFAFRPEGLANDVYCWIAATSFSWRVVARRD